MNPLEQVGMYLQRLEKRLRWTALTRGLAVLTAAALIATVLIVYATNRYAFSEGSLLGGRFALFLCLALALGFGIVIPLLRLNRNRAARLAEARVPEFKERL